jgi:6-phosphogluconolactonase
MIAARRDFPDRQSLASALAADMAQHLRSAVEARGRALLAVSGGNTPKLFFDSLSRERLDWPRITLTLVDERCVPDSDERSNARLVKSHLLVGNAASATFVPLYKNERAAASLGAFDAVTLGMGTDGHTASFFPGGDHLAAALDPRAKGIVTMKAASAGEPRLTFTLPELLKAKHIVLHIEGDDKARALAKAMEPGAVEAMPVRAVLNAPNPLVIYWSP